MPFSQSAMEEDLVKKVMRSLVEILCLTALMPLGAQVIAQSQPARPSTQAAKAADPWNACRFLLGTWTATQGSGQPGEAVSGETTFSLDLGDKIIVRKNRADYAPKPGETAGFSHQDLLLIYLAMGETQLKAFYIDNEGHEIRYRVSFPKPNAAAFESEGSPQSPRYRLEYSLGADGTLTISFLIAPPGGEFKIYTVGKARKK
jgi:hypothetical protein